MQWGSQQAKAIDETAKFLKDPDGQQVFHLFGYAGTGKTTIAKHIAETIGGRVEFMAYTGKAASVMRKNGCKNATTIHKKIYRSRDKSKEKLEELQDKLAEMEKRLKGIFFTEEMRSFLKKADLDPASVDNDQRIDAYNALSEEEQTAMQLRIQHSIKNETEYKKLEKLVTREAELADAPAFTINEESDVTDCRAIFIDECSMVDGRLAEDIMWFNKPIVVLGDPAQLPPIGGGGFFTEGIKPQIMLTEIHRQAEGNPIIEMATKVRQGETLLPGMYGSSEVKARGDKVPDILAFDQVICGKNATRKVSNDKIRRMLGFTDRYPMVGDRLVCLKNNHDIGILNGVLFDVLETNGVDENMRVHLSITNEDCDEPISVQAIEHHFLGKGDELKKQWQLKQNADEFDYGYALTCHKAQGSQWKSVCVFDESGVFRKDKNRWLYTAITRASEQVTICKM